MVPDDILSMDANDPLANKRKEFLLPKDTLYLDGNSLGPLTKRAKQRVAQVIQQQWGEDLIASWNKHDWIKLPVTVGEKIARLIGAQHDQVISCDSTSVNLFKLLACALTLNSSRKVILSQQDNFPTDLYMAQGLTELLGEQRCRAKLVSSQQLESALDETVAVLMLTQVNFRSGALHDMQRLTELAHQKGILVIWDLAHSAGALPVMLDEARVDFAVGCGYKYLNGGPGAPAFVYVAERHQAHISQPLQGWMGHHQPFAFEPAYQAAAGVEQCLAGTPGILSMVALDAALDVFADVDLYQLREKSIALSELFIQCVAESPELEELELLSPTDPKQRGSQLAYAHTEAFAISQALIASKVVVDFRAPNVIRFGFTPLYTRYIDIWHAAQTLLIIITEKTYLEPKFQSRNTVT